MIYHNFAFLIIPFLYFGNSHDVIRNTQYGQIRGEVKSSRALGSSLKYYYFASVPYARPPMGKLRFQDPQPPVSWTGVRYVTGRTNVCTQILNSITGDISGSEDCLYLEISVPIQNKMHNVQKFPVLVWIHGGTFLFGTVRSTGADYFMEESAVIVVQVEYRLNVLGFLSTKDEYAKGNAGLKDQTLALKWIQNNIKNFGGDPKRVTIFGSSAGGASVQLHMLSPQSKGLFHRAISQSGTPLNRWAFQRNPLKMVLKLAKGLGITETNHELLVEKLQNVPVDQLLKAAFNKSIVGFFLPYTEQPFSPSIEETSNVAFLTESVYKLLEEGNIAYVPYMMGYNTEEGSFPYTYINDSEVDINIYEERPELIVPLPMNIPKHSPCNDITLRRIKQYYFNNGSLNNKTNWINYMSVDLFIRGILKSTEMICRKPKYQLYFYIFSFKGSLPMSYLGGAGHFNEVIYLLYALKPAWIRSETNEDKLTRRRLVKLWLNFAVWGNPTPSPQKLLQNVNWETFCSNKMYLDIGAELILKNNPNSKDVSFWEMLFNTCGYSPFYTY